MSRPLIGVTTYLVPADWGVWTAQQAALLPVQYATLVQAAGGASIEIEATLETMPSPMWDAVVIDASADALAKVGPAVEFVKEQFRHCKTLLIAGPVPALLAAAGIDAPADPGFIDATANGLPAKAATEVFIKAVGRHKHYEREKDPSPV